MALGGFLRADQKSRSAAAANAGVMSKFLTTPWIRVLVLPHFAPLSFATRFLQAYTQLPTKLIASTATESG